ncbi:MAG: hypothetical protein GY950_19420 [bacterium]|nr:hypothetical protein [bacterium]
MFRKIVVVNGDTLVIPELKKFRGEKVEITLKTLSEKRKSRKNLKHYFGKLKTESDAVAFQKKVRAEWEEREKSF